MKNELDPTKILHAYEVIMERGTPTEFGKIYEGVEAFSDYDGYSVYMRGNGVELKIGFHNTYHLDYDPGAPQRELLEESGDAGEIARRVQLPRQVIKF